MKELGLGSASGAYAVSLADARDKAHAIRSGLRNGVLPPMLTHGKGNGARCRER